MALKEKAVKIAVKEAIKYVRKDYDTNLFKLIDWGKKMVKEDIHLRALNKLGDRLSDPENMWAAYIKKLIMETDPGIIEKLIPPIMNTVIKSYDRRLASMKEHGCNIPWAILVDITTACNLKCTGCWAAEYGHNLQLSLDDMRSIVTQGKAMGTHFYMLTGGEPLIRKKDIITLASENPECGFLIYTNATLIDKALCDDIKRCGNITLALSIEGDEHSNDSRRGEGAYKTTMEAMKLLKAEKLLFGISVCYTSANVDYVTSEEFIDKMVGAGVKYAFYFSYMPVGKDAVKELIPTPSQRKYMYFWMKKMRNKHTGKPLFVMDFQDDGEYVGGCIAGGRNYFHINSNGDIEPCVFIHFSDSNIRKDTLFEALNKPLFMAYRKGQPFNDNHLMPCPMLENPDILRKIIKETNAKSTDFISKETVEELCSKCDDFSKAWAPVAKEIWDNNSHPKTHTQYYRDHK